MGNANGQELFRLVDALASLRPFNAERVSKTTGAVLELVASESNNYFFVYRSVAPAALFTEVELLTIREDIPATEEDVLARFGDPPDLVPPTPRQPSDAPVYFQYAVDWGTLSFGFPPDSEGQLTIVILDATDGKTE